MAIAARVLFEVVLVVFLGREEVYQRANLHVEFPAAAPLDSRYSLHRLLCRVVRVIDAGLVLRAPVVPLPVFHGGVYDVEIGQQQRVKAHLLRVVLDPHRLAKARLAGADGLVIGILRAGAVCVAALRVYDARYRLHQLLQPPEAASGQVNDVFSCIHMCSPFRPAPVARDKVHCCYYSTL